MAMRAFLFLLVFVLSIPASAGEFEEYRHSVRSFLNGELHRYFTTLYALEGGKMRVQVLYNLIQFKPGRPEAKKPKRTDPVDRAIEEVLKGGY